MYIAPGQGQTAPRGQIFYVNRNFLSLTFFPYKSIRDQIWPCHKTGQGQPRVIIEQTQAPDAAYQVSRSSAFWFRRRFFKVFTTYGHGSHLGYVTRNVWTNFCSPIPWRLKGNLASIGPVVSEEKMIKVCGRWRDRWWTPTYPISSPMSLQLRWAKNWKVTFFKLFLQLRNYGSVFWCKYDVRWPVVYLNSKLYQSMIKSAFWENYSFICSIEKKWYLIS